MKDQDDTRDDFHGFLAFAIIGTATTIWALAVGGFAIWWSGAL
jgi:hypothetical protein